MYVKTYLAIKAILILILILCGPDEEDCRLAGRGAVQRGPPGGAAQRRDAGGAEGRRHRPLQRRQGEGPGHHQRVRTRYKDTDPLTGKCC